MARKKNRTSAAREALRNALSAVSKPVSKKRTRPVAKALEDALLADGPMVRELYEFDLERHVEFFKRSKRDDGDDYFFAVTENRGHVAMVLIEKDDTVHINEAARTRLQELWPLGYKSNMRLFIPQMVDEFERDCLFQAGFIVADRPSLASRFSWKKSRGW